VTSEVERHRRRHSPFCSTRSCREPAYPSLDDQPTLRLDDRRTVPTYRQRRGDLMASRPLSEIRPTTIRSRMRRRPYPFDVSSPAAQITTMCPPKGRLSSASVLPDLRHRIREHHRSPSSSPLELAISSSRSDEPIPERLSPGDAVTYRTASSQHYGRSSGHRGAVRGEGAKNRCRSECFEADIAERRGRRGS